MNDRTKGYAAQALQALDDAVTSLRAVTEVMSKDGGVGITDMLTVEDLAKRAKALRRAWGV